MRSVFALVFFVLLLSSCAQIYFSEPQPSKGMVIKSFIDNIQGEYSDSLLKVEVLKNELVIEDEHFKLANKNPQNNEVVVKFYKDFYFASFKDSAYYSVFMCKFYDNKLAVYALPADKRSVQRLKNFGEVVLTDSISGSYLMTVSKKQFDMLMDYEMFNVLNVLKKN